MKIKINAECKKLRAYKILRDPESQLSIVLRQASSFSRQLSSILVKPNLIRSFDTERSFRKPHLVTADIFGVLFFTRHPRGRFFPPTSGIFKNPFKKERKRGNRTNGTIVGYLRFPMTEGWFQWLENISLSMWFINRLGKAERPWRSRVGKRARLQRKEYLRIRRECIRGMLDEKKRVALELWKTAWLTRLRGLLLSTSLRRSRSRDSFSARGNINEPRYSRNGRSWEMCRVREISLETRYDVRSK